MSRKREKNTEEENKLSKEQEDVAKYIRFNCPTSTTMFEGNEVHYFSGNKAVDTLYESKYGTKAKSNPLVKTRTDAVIYISDLLSKQLFFRAKTLVPKKKEDKGDTGNPSKSPKAITEKKNKKKKDEETVTETEAEDKKKDEDDDENKAKSEKKKKKKVKLIFHSVQSFVDDKDVYVWIFDPTPLYKKVIGVLMLVAAVVGSLFPLWPEWLRNVAYYFCVSAMGVLGGIIALAIARTILFGIIWLATLGKHKLWILPNLTEDCGVLESFKPLYTYEYCGKKEENKNKKKGKKDKDSDNEEEKALVEEEKRDSSIEDDYEKIENEAERTEEEGSATDEQDSDNASSVPPSPSEPTVRKRKPAKI